MTLTFFRLIMKAYFIIIDENKKRERERAFVPKSPSTLHTRVRESF